MKRRDPVTPELRETILKRDRICFLARDESIKRFGVHICRDRWRNAHSCGDTNRLEIEHFWTVSQGVMGKRAPSTLRTCIALCGYANYQGPTKEMRTAMREYTASLYPDDEQAEPSGA